MRRLGLAVVLLAMAGVHAAEAGGRTPLPAVTQARPGTQCVAPPEVMRRSHMGFLKHQRDDTVRGGIRGARFSLKGCVACHASQKTRSVASAEGDFCLSCHAYAAVKIDCFECHSSQAHAMAQGAAK